MEQVVDMDISIEEEETDDEAELSELLKGLNGMEKCLIPIAPKTDKAIIGQAEKQTVRKTATPNETNNTGISLKNQTKTATEITSKSTKSPTVSVEHIVDIENDNSDKAPSPSSDASTLSRGPTPEKELMHCPKDKETTVPTQIIDNDSDSDVIVEHVTKHHEESSNLDEKTKNCAKPNNSESNSKSNGTTELDDVEKTPENSHPEGEISVLPVETQDRSKDLDSDSDCLIVEHIAPSEHLQNGCIDLTKPAEDEDVSFALANCSEESLVEEIMRIRKAIRKHDRKRQKKSRRRRSQKQKKRPKSKNRIRSPSLDKVSESEDEIRTIMFTESGQLSVNITSNDSSRVSFSSRDSSKSLRLRKTNVSAENELNRTSVSEGQCGSNNSDSQQSRPEITASTEMADHADSAPLRNSDSENNTKVAKNSNSIKINPLKRKLSYQVQTNLSNQPVKKQIFCESSKELRSKFRRNVIPKAKRDRGGSGVRAERGATLENTNSFDRFMSDSEDDNVNNLRSRSSSLNSGITEKFIRSLCQPKSSRRTPPLLDDNYRKSRSHCRSPNNYRKRNPPSPVRSIRSRSRSYRSPSRSRRSRSRVYRSPSPKRSRRSKSRTYCSTSRLRRSKSRTHISSSRSRRSKSRTYRSPSPLRRSKSHTYVSPSRLRRSKSRTYVSPSRLRRSKSRTYRSPSRLRRSKSRTYVSPSRLRRSKSRTYTSPYRLRRSKSRTYTSPSRLRRTKSRTCRSPSRSRRSKSRNHRSPSCSRRSISQERRSMSCHRTPRKKCASRSSSEIRAARKCSPLENMRQQLKKNNEAAVQQALGGLEKPTTSGVSKTWSARIIDDVDLTKSSPSPENTTQPFVMNRNAPPVPSNLVYMPMPRAINPGVLNQMNRLQISDVYSQSVTFPEHYVPFYQ